jgi:hypothetical protein
MTMRRAYLTSRDRPLRFGPSGGVAAARIAVLALALSAAAPAWPAGWNAGAVADQGGGYLAVQAQREVAPDSPLADREFKRAYYRALGPRVKEPWLAQLDGPSPGQKSMQIAGFDYVALAYCKARDCHDHNTVLLYSRAQGKVYGLVFEAGLGSLIGDPPAPVAAALERLWRDEWRQSR